MYWLSIGQRWLVLGGTVLIHFEAVIDVIGSVESIDAFMHLKMNIWSRITDA